VIHGWSAFGGADHGWQDIRLERGAWTLAPFLDRLGHKARRQMCPLYVSGLIGPGDRKSIQPMAERLALGDYDRLHHFIAAGVWDASGRVSGGWSRRWGSMKSSRLKVPSSRFDLSITALGQEDRPALTPAQLARPSRRRAQLDELGRRWRKDCMGHTGRTEGFSSDN
jgi:hypothetical protein